MQLKLACADFSFPLLSHDGALDLIAMLGFDGVDIGLFEGRSHLWPSRVFKQLERGLTASIATRSTTLPRRSCCEISFVRAMAGVRLVRAAC